MSVLGRLVQRGRPFPIQGVDIRPAIRAYVGEPFDALQVSVLSRLVPTVYTVERHQTLIDYARACLQTVGYDNIFIRHGDGTQGWPEHAPYDGIIVAAGGPAIPAALCRQLAIGGRLIMPVGQEQRRQDLIRLTRLGEDNFRRRNYGPVAFVPLVGAEGWPE